MLLQWRRIQLREWSGSPPKLKTCACRELTGTPHGCVALPRGDGQYQLFATSCDHAPQGEPYLS